MPTCGPYPHTHIGEDAWAGTSVCTHVLVHGCEHLQPSPPNTQRGRIESEKDSEHFSFIVLTSFDYFPCIVLTSFDHFPCIVLTSF